MYLEWYLNGKKMMARLLQTETNIIVGFESIDQPLLDDFPPKGEGIFYCSTIHALH